jgi:hypothetical protein
MTARPGICKNDRLTFITLARGSFDLISDELVNDWQLLMLMSENEVTLNGHWPLFVFDEIRAELMGERVRVAYSCRKVYAL